MQEIKYTPTSKIDKELAREMEAKRQKRKEKEENRRRLDKLEARNWRDKTLHEMTERDWRILKEEFRISTKFGGRLPNPIRFWNESGLSQSILKSIHDVAKYSEPSPIQRMAIPIGLSNRDCVGIAETGSGKTAAFVLPMLVYLDKLPGMNSELFEDGPYAIVLAPTRELAKQIEEETNKFAIFLKHITAVTIVGGIDQQTQSKLLRNGASVIIATPGRLIDMCESSILVLNQCNYVVLDEADRMIDLGFEPQVNEIFEKMPATNMRPIDDEECEKDRIYRQTFMFSATMPIEIERMTRKYLRNPVYITIGDPNATAAERVRQHIVWINAGSNNNNSNHSGGGGNNNNHNSILGGGDKSTIGTNCDTIKRRKLIEILRDMQPPIIIFTNMKKNTDALAKYLRQNNTNTHHEEYKAVSLHGGKSQENREHVFKQFKEHKIDILVCTNVGARGIDVHGINHVINYDMPNNIQDYCHRIGRTGRAGMSGQATSFLTKDDTDIMYDLKKMLVKTGNHVPPELMNHEAALRNPNAVYQQPKTTKQILAKVKPLDT